MITYDGLMYDFQAVGEFILAVDASSNLMVQVRMGPYIYKDAQLSVNTAVAAMVGSDKVGFYLNETPPLYINGSPVTISGLYKLPGGGEIEIGGNQYTIFWPSRERSLIVEVHPNLLNVRLSRSDNDMNVSGLLGNTDCSPDNDLKTRDGRLIDWVKNPPSFLDLYRDFADSWRITGAESLFDYKSGQTTATFTDRKYPKKLYYSFSLDAEDRAYGEAQCQAAGVPKGPLFEACVLDMAVLKNPEIPKWWAQQPPPVAVTQARGEPPDGNQE